MLTYALIALGVLLFLILTASFIAYRMTFYYPRKNQTTPHSFPKGKKYDNSKRIMIPMVDELLQIPFEEVYIKSHDGKMLFGRYYHVKDGAPLQIEVHGYKGNAYRDFCGGHKIGREMGHNCLLIDMRAHGKSGSHTITFGLLERYDCLRWIEWAVSRFGDIPIVLVGVSMGASTVLMLSDMDLPKNVKCIVADCPFSAPPAIIKKVAKKMGAPVKLVYPFVVLGGALFGHFNINKHSPIEAVKHSRLPILLLHGENDGYVPEYMSREIFDACTSEKARYTFPNAEHGLSFVADMERYRTITEEFINSHL